MGIKLSPDVLRRLVLLNTAVLAVIALAGLAVVAVAVRTDKVRNTLRAILDKEKQQSELLDRLGGSDETATLERWGLKIEPRHMREIQALTTAVRDANALTDEHKRWFPATLIVDGVSYDGKVRLRGDLESHWRGGKKSWRFRAKRERYVRGYREIDLIIPRDKAYEVEHVSYALARDLGLFAPDSGFVNVDLNGVDMGAYFWREPPGKEALERLRYPEGEIFAEQNTWIQEFFSGRGIYRLYSPPVSFFPANWEGDVHGDAPNAGYFAARWNRLLDLVVQAPDPQFAAELPTLLDIDGYLAWNALTWLFGSTHSHWGDNLSWYYDNTTGRFEPLLYDVFRYAIEKGKLGTFEATEHDELAVRVMRDPHLRQRRNAILWRLVTDPRFDVARRAAEAGPPLFDHFARGVDAPSRASVEAFHGETLQILDANRQLIHDHLAFGRVFVAPELDRASAMPQMRWVSRGGSPALPATSSSRRASIEDGRGLFERSEFRKPPADEARRPSASAPTLRLRLVPDALADLEWQGLSLALRTGLGRAPTEVQATLVAPDGTASPVDVRAALRDLPQPPATEVEPTVTDEVVVPPPSIAVDLTFDPPIVLSTPVDERLIPRMATYTLELVWPGGDTDAWVTPGTVARVETTVVHSLLGETLPPSHVYQAVPAYAFAFRATDEAASNEDADDTWPWQRDGDTLVIPAGTHRLEHDLVVGAPGVPLRIEAGARLRMAPGVSLLHRGPLEVRGTAARPAIIEPLDDAEPWGAFAIVGVRERSRVKHLRVRGGSEDWVDGVYASGQLCFYGAPVDLVSVAVLDARADDGLNIKRADMTIRDSTFSGNAFDAFDGDWVQGTIERTRFLDNGGDGLDVSGADVLVRDSLFQRQADKSLSVGENSRVTAINVVVRDSFSGVAIKDLSRALIVGSVLYGNETAVTLYRKKPIFGGGHGALVSTLVWKNQVDYTPDAESSLRLVGVAQDAYSRRDGVTVVDHRLAPLDAHYRVRGEVDFAHVGDGASPFARGPMPSSVALPTPDPVLESMLDADALDGLTLDDGPIGLFGPIDLERCPPVRASS